jgi:glycosyltransferase involved in cell wall biosynthesis
MNKLVSVILPTYNGSPWIQRAIESVTSQSYRDLELLVVDDGSTDNTAVIVANMAQNDSRIRYIKNDVNSGIQKTLNHGLKEAKGEYIARIDDDDYWVDTDKLQKQVDFLNNNPDHVLVGTGVIIVNEKGDELFRYLVPTTNESIQKRLLGKNCFVHSSVMFKNSAVMQFGGYSEGVEEKHFEDYDLWLKLGTIGKLANLPIYALQYTMREGSLSAVNRVEVFHKILKHLNKYKNSYKGYYGALLRAYARYIL